MKIILIIIIMQHDKINPKKINTEKNNLILVQENLIKVWYGITYKKINFQIFDNV